jgi:hypothetical protein
MRTRWLQTAQAACERANNHPSNAACEHRRTWVRVCELLERGWRRHDADDAYVGWVGAPPHDLTQRLSVEQRRC